MLADYNRVQDNRQLPLLMTYVYLWRGVAQLLIAMRGYLESSPVHHVYPAVVRPEFSVVCVTGRLCFEFHVLLSKLSRTGHGFHGTKSIGSLGTGDSTKPGALSLTSVASPVGLQHVVHQQPSPHVMPCLETTTASFVRFWCQHTRISSK